MIALPVILIPAGLTSVQHLVTLPDRPYADKLPPVQVVRRVHVQLRVAEEEWRPGVDRIGAGAVSSDQGRASDTALNSALMNSPEGAVCGMHGGELMLRLFDSGRSNKFRAG